MYQNLIRPCSVRNHGADFGLLIQIQTLRKHIICTPTARSWYSQVFITNSSQKYLPLFWTHSSTGTSIPAEYVDPYLCYQYSYIRWFTDFLRTTQVPGTRTYYGRTGSQYLASQVRVDLRCDNYGCTIVAKFSFSAKTAINVCTHIPQYRQPECTFKY